MEDSILVLFLLAFCLCGIQTAVSDEGCLVDNTTSLENGFTGQLKFCRRNWGAVCSLDEYNLEFTRVDSQVVCYELGYSGDGANFTIGHNNIPKNYIALAGVRCRGDEERLSECHHPSITEKEITDCKDTDESVYVTCSKESQVRLHNYRDEKLQDYRGVVEHWYNGRWHVLCDTGEWTLNDSQVVCQQLGLGNAVKLGQFKADDGSLGYLRSGIDCEGNETMIRKCRTENAWNASSTCGRHLAHANCEGPVVQDNTITSSTSDSVTLSWTLPSNFNKAVVTEFRVEYWPEGHKSQKRCFDQSSNFSNATLNFLHPNTTYEMVIVSMMGEHPGPKNGTHMHMVKTRENPVIVGLKSEIKDLQGNITGLEGEIKGLQGNITGLEGEIKGLQGNITGLEGEKEGLQDNITGLKGEKKGLTIGLSCVLVGMGIIILIAIILKIGRFIQRRRCRYQNIPNGNEGQPLRVNSDVYFDARDGR